MKDTCIRFEYKGKQYRRWVMHDSSHDHYVIWATYKDYDTDLGGLVDDSEEIERHYLRQSKLERIIK